MKVCESAGMGCIDSNAQQTGRRKSNDVAVGALASGNKPSKILIVDVGK
jgi:hypothetical protein